MEFLSCNLINPKAVDTLISDHETWDLIFNCAGETRPGQDDQVYKVNVKEPGGDERLNERKVNGFDSRCQGIALTRSDAGGVRFSGCAVPDQVVVCRIISMET